MIYLTDGLLRRYIDNGTIRPSDVVDSNEEDIMKTIIEKVHPFKITAPKKGASDSRWFTYIPDEKSPNGRKRVAKKSQKELFVFLLGFYGISESSLKGSMSFGELYYEWTNYKEEFVKATNKKKALSPSTVNRYRRDYKKCFAGTNLDSTPLMNVTSIQLEKEIKNAIVKHKLSESFAANLIGYISNAFSYAVRNRYVTTNEFLFVDKARVLSFVTIKPPKSDADRVLTQNELKALNVAIRSHEAIYPTYMPDYAIELAMRTGMRVGELAALHWSDIRDGVIHIDYSEHRNDYEDHSELVIEEPKNLKHREFPLNDDIEEIFNRIKALGIESEFVFARENGKRYTAHDISCACDRRANEAGIKKTSIHGIRRTVASEMRKYASIKLVSNLLGHLEETDEGYYNYDNSDFDEKKAITKQLCSNVLNFEDATKNKKRAKAL